MMADMTKELRATLIKEFDILRDVTLPEVFNTFMVWMRGDYIKYMIISREAYKETLDKCIADYPSDKHLFGVLKKHLDEYGATQAYFRVALHYLEEATND